MSLLLLGKLGCWIQNCGQMGTQATKSECPNQHRTPARKLASSSVMLLVSSVDTSIQDSRFHLHLHVLSCCLESGVLWAFELWLLFRGFRSEAEPSHQMNFVQTLGDYSLLSLSRSLSPSLPLSLYLLLFPPSLALSLLISSLPLSVSYSLFLSQFVPSKTSITNQFRDSVRIPPQTQGLPSAIRLCFAPTNQITQSDL